MDDPILSPERRDDRRLLARIGVANEELHIRWRPIQVGHVGRQPPSGRLGARATVASDRGDDLVRRHLRSALAEVLHHGHLLEGEVAQDHTRDDSEPLDVTRGLDEPRKHRLGLEGLLVLSAIVFDKQGLHGQGNSVLGLEEVEEHQVGLDVACPPQRKHAALTPTLLDRHGNKQHR